MKFVFAVTFLAMTVYGFAAQEGVVRPFEKESTILAPNPIDSLVLASLHKKNIEPANLCSDEVFVRRVYIDVIGTLPTADEVKKFLDDKDTGKRAKLIETLLKRDEFTDYWTLKWCDLLRVKAEFPVNLWPNAVQTYNRWIHDAVEKNMPYDKFARELLTSSGSNFRVPQVNFYRAIQGRDPNAIAEAVALTFMGMRADSMSKEARRDMAVFFSRVAYKSTAEWKEEIVYLDPKPAAAMDAVFPDGTKVQITPEQDPREVFADWLISQKNPWFAKNIVNRMWAWLVGRGIVDKPDDIRPDNPPANPELLAYLEGELIKSNYDLKRIYRLILKSRTYQQSSIAKSSSAEAGKLFAYYPVRRLDAEVLIDALNKIGGSSESYSSAIPEPFTFIPEKNRTITLADGSITSSFLEMFGRPSRDTGLESERNNEPTDEQRLYLLNSAEMQRKIQQSQMLRDIKTAGAKNPSQMVNNIYLNILSRYPTEAEAAMVDKYLKTAGKNRNGAAEDLAWALINSKEFLYRH